MLKKIDVKLMMTWMLGFFVVTSSETADATNLWSVASTVNDDVDGLFYNGNEFTAYRLAPTLRLYTSSNGVDWVIHDSSLTPLSVGHDGHGGFCALTSVAQESGFAGYYNYTAQIWRSADGDNWRHTADLVTYFEILPAGAVFCGGESNLLVKLYNTWGAGWVSGPPPTPLFIADKLSPDVFATVPGGDYINNIAWTGARYVAVLSNKVTVSVDGRDWDPLFSLSASSPPDRIVTSWQNQFFTFGHFSGIQIVNGLSEPVQFNSPTAFSDMFQPLVEFAYNGNAFVLTDQNTSYVSTNQAITWEVMPQVSVRGLASDGAAYLLADQQDANTVFYRFVSPVAVLSGAKPISMQLSVTKSGARTLNKVQLYPMNPSDTNQYIQVEVSPDLFQWNSCGLPTTNVPIVVQIDNAVSSKAFFRLRIVE